MQRIEHGIRAHKTVLGIADVVIQAIQKGILKNIFRIGGCDGFEPQSKYFTELATASPKESLILNMGLAKYRLNHLNLGNLGDTDIPRVLDSYSAVIVALELAKALGTNVNSLPLHLAFTWFEQKAIAVLMTLLHLGIRDIRVGPMAPAFLTPGVMKMLNEKFNLQVVHPKDVNGDLKEMLKKLEAA
jgi:hydroxylamine reductase